MDVARNGKLVTADGDKIVIQFAYDPQLVTAVKASVPLVKYDRQRKCWLSSPGLYREIRQFADKHRFHVEYSAAFLLDQAELSRNESRMADTEADIPVPAGLAYLPYQKAGIALAAKRKQVLLGDSMGLGKTIQAIGLVNLVDEIQTALIVCPASLKLNWYRELNKWLVRKRNIAVADSGWFPTADIIILNYDILQKHEARIRSVKWDYLVLDEAHYLKNPETIRSVMVFGNLKSRKRKKIEHDVTPIEAGWKLFMTGTPIVNRPMELWGLIHALDPVSFPSKWAYYGRYCGGTMTKFGYQYQGASNLEELQDRLRSTVLIRRLKKDVLTDLPPKRRQVVEFSVGTADGAVKAEVQAYQRYQEILAELRVSVELAKASDVPEEYDRAVHALRQGVTAAFTEMAKLRKETAIAKVQHVIAHLHDVLDDGEEKVVLFAHHHEVINAFAKEFGKLCVTLTGQTEMKARQAAVDRFQTDPTCKLFIGGIQAAGVGLTLTASSHVVFAELDWVPGNISQAEDRCILEGQPVLTVEGWKPIQKIAVGDLVIGQDGLPHAVTDTWNRLARSSHAHKTKVIAEIVVRGWLDPILVTGEHRMLTEGGWVEAQGLRPGDRLVMPTQTNGDLASVAFDDECRIARSYVTPAIMRKGGRPKPEAMQRNGRLAPPAPTDVHLDEEAMFVFGYYLGDGFCYVGQDKGRFVSFAGHKNQKVSHLRRCAEWGGKYGLENSLYDRKDGSGCELRVFSGEWAYWFTKHFGRTLHEKYIPGWAHSTSQKLRWSLLDGLLASDGYVRPATKGGALRHEVVTASWRLAADIARLMMGLGLKACVNRGSKGQYSVQFSHGERQSLAVSSLRLRWPGKQERVYDLTVADSATFIVGTAVVHNCHRISQRNAVLVQHLVLEGSLDATMAKKVIQKQEIIDRALDMDTSARELADAPAVADGEADTHATDGTSKKKIEAEAAKLQPEQIRAIHEALRMLAGLCDGARQLDGSGFNRIDARIGHSLAHAPRLTPKQAALGKRIATKYRRQLPESIVEAMAEREEVAV